MASQTTTKPEHSKSQINSLPVAVPNGPSDSVSRKKKRRTQTSGAANDCFACQERGSKCDRRRPYCTPCLDVGKDCSGYKTTLTWGVGVASRGKLRGLSLPIASSKRAVQSEDDDEPAVRSKPPHKLPKYGPKFTSVDPKASVMHPKYPSPTTSQVKVATSMASPPNFGFVGIDPTAGTTLTSSPPLFSRTTQSWTPGNASSHTRSNLRSTKPASRGARKHAPQPVNVADAWQHHASVMGADIIEGYSDLSSSSISPTVPTFTGYGLLSGSKMSSQYPKTFNPYQSDLNGIANLYWPGERLDSSHGSDQSSQATADEFQSDYGGMDGVFSLSGFSKSASSPLRGLSTTSTPYDRDLTFNSGNFQSSPTCVNDPPGLVPDFPSPGNAQYALHTSSLASESNLPYLIDFYNKIISPVFSGPETDQSHRRPAMQRLIMDSETIQHAIAALASCNIRMKKKLALGDTNEVKGRRGSAASAQHESPINGSSLLPYEASDDELLNKIRAEKGLFSIISTPNAAATRNADETIACLMTLSLYQICDIGVSQFKTQFAIVRNIMAARGGVTGANSKVANWLTLMFSWFNSITSQAQTLDEFEPMVQAETESVKAELAACNSELLRLIAKIGGLTAPRDLRANSTPLRRGSHNVALGAGKMSSSPLTSDYYSMHFSADGDIQQTWSGNGEPLGEHHQIASQDAATQKFWLDWAEARRKLRDWQADLPNNTEAGSDDLSEAFRYAALLYLERLAFPQMPNTHPNLQALLAQVVYYMSIDDSDPSICWALFLASNDAVASQTTGLRQVCLQLQRQASLFNGAGNLHMLSRLWRDDVARDPSTSPHSSRSPPFASRQSFCPPSNDLYSTEQFSTSFNTHSNPFTPNDSSNLNNKLKVRPSSNTVSPSVLIPQRAASFSGPATSHPYLTGPRHAPHRSISGTGLISTPTPTATQPLQRTISHQQSSSYAIPASTARPLHQLSSSYPPFQSSNMTMGMYTNADSGVYCKRTARSGPELDLSLPMDTDLDLSLNLSPYDNSLGLDPNTIRWNNAVKPSLDRDFVIA